MTVISRPAMSDDSGSLTDGTVTDKAFMDAIMDEIDTQCHSAANPTITPVNTTDEVVTARGSMGSLDTRLDVSLEENGDLKTQASLVTATQAGGLPQTNTVVNDIFIVWTDGDAAAADGWVLAGGGAAVARAGTGLGDTKRKVGDFCSKLTYGAATLTYYNEILTTAAYSRLDHLDAEIVGFGAWVWADAASQTRLYVADGATTTYSTAYHTGGGAWEWLSGTHTISGSATYLRAGCAVESGGVNPAYLSGYTVIFGEIAPVNWRPCPTAYGTVAHKITGAATVAEIDRYVLQRPGIVKDVQLYANTAPVGADFIIDVNGGDGTNSMFSTLPQIDDGDSAGSQIPDGTYAYRCFKGYSGDTPGTGKALLMTECTQIGSGTAGSDVNVLVRVQVFLDPFEMHKAA